MSQTAPAPQTPQRPAAAHRRVASVSGSCSFSSQTTGSTWQLRALGGGNEDFGLPWITTWKNESGHAGVWPHKFRLDLPVTRVSKGKDDATLHHSLCGGRVIKQSQEWSRLQVVWLNQSFVLCCTLQALSKLLVFDRLWLKGIVHRKMKIQSSTQHYVDGGGVKNTVGVSDVNSVSSKSNTIEVTGDSFKQKDSILLLWCHPSVWKRLGLFKFDFKWDHLHHVLSLNVHYDPRWNAAPEEDLRTFRQNFV